MTAGVNLLLARMNCYSAFGGILVRLASGLSRLAWTFGCIIPDIGPTMLLDEGHCCWESFECPVEVPHYELWSRFHAFKLGFNSGEDVVRSSSKVISFFGPGSPVDDGTVDGGASSIEAHYLASPTSYRI